MFSYENYLPFTSFNESSIFFKASEVFRWGFLLADFSDGDIFRQLYSYHNYYVEITFGENYEEIKTIEGVTIDDALSKYLDHDILDLALMDLFVAD